jgi:hypothetical protein
MIVRAVAMTLPRTRDIRRSEPCRAQAVDLEGGHRQPGRTNGRPRRSDRLRRA